MASKKPTQAPFWNVDGFITKLNQLAAKAGITPFSTTDQPAWKRWVEASGDQDVNGLRDVVNANAIYIDAIKGDVDIHGQRLNDHETRIAASEALPPPTPPFPA